MSIIVLSELVTNSNTLMCHNAHHTIRTGTHSALFIMSTVCRLLDGKRMHANHFVTQIVNGDFVIQNISVYYNSKLQCKSAASLYLL